MTSAYTLVQFEREMMEERLKAKRTLQIIAERNQLGPFCRWVAKIKIWFGILCRMHGNFRQLHMHEVIIVGNALFRAGGHQEPPTSS